MGLRDLIDAVQGRTRTLVVRAPRGDASLVAKLRGLFAFRNVAVEHAVTDGDRVEARLLGADGDTLATVEGHAVRALVDPDRRASGGDTAPYAPILEHIEEATFTSRDHEQMMLVTREIEDRAWRVGGGTLHAGFQRLSAFRPQADVYRRLADSDLAVHVYGVRDADPPGGPFAVHVTDDPDVAQSWFVAFDGGDTDAQKCALLAEERGEGEYYGFWTYDTDTVDDILAELPTGTVLDA